MSDYYDDIYRQRGADEVFRIAANHARKLREEAFRLRQTLVPFANHATERALGAPCQHVTDK
jgi:hypothetical protein